MTPSPCCRWCEANTEDFAAEIRSMEYRLREAPSPPRSRRSLDAVQELAALYLPHRVFLVLSRACRAVERGTAGKALRRAVKLAGAGAVLTCLALAFLAFLWLLAVLWWPAYGAAVLRQRRASRRCW